MFNWILETFFFSFMPGYSFQRKLRKLSRDEHGQLWLAKIKHVINTLSHQGKERNSQNVAIISRLSCQQHYLQENLVFACKPCIYSPPWHTWGKEKKKNPHNFTCIAFFFFTFSGRMTEKVFRAKEQPVQGWTAVNSGTFILILSTSRTGRPQDSACCPLRF